MDISSEVMAIYSPTIPILSEVIAISSERMGINSLFDEITKKQGCFYPSKMTVFGHFSAKIPSPLMAITSEVILISSEVIAINGERMRINSENFGRKGHFFRILSFDKKKY